VEGPTCDSWKSQGLFSKNDDDDWVDRYATGLTRGVGGSGPQILAQTAVVRRRATVSGGGTRRRSSETSIRDQFEALLGSTHS
jgi:hypothetical protein